ncbi:Pro-Pol polyprotein [Araneus ventricosus]|uniref:Pro-Pol polyprotein n=1 Tax=Araneus ventricosus TaxID=182803 RepID=A0A4Y2ALG0_ARAVE|nr:Pro-Pol polyprotein [Araneus ventricosus]
MRSAYDKAKPNKPKLGNETKDRIKAPKIENKDKFKDTKLNNIRCFNCNAIGNKSSVCENKIKGIECFKCNKFGDHLAKDCSMKYEHSNVTVDKAASFENLTKIVRINDLNIVSLIDTGSQKTLIRKSIFDKIGEISELEQYNIKLSGLGNTSVKPLGIFKTKILIDDLEFEAEICVVSDSSLSFDLIVGCNVINECTLIVSGKEIKFTKPSDNSISDSFLINVPEVMTHEQETNLTHIQNKAYQEKVINLLHSKKQGKQEGELHPIPKVELPLDTYHVDHLGLLESTNKNYKYILCVIESLTKFAWLYPTKSTSSQEVISKLQLQKPVFGNPRRIISDKVSAFNSKEFDDYCSSESIQHLSVTTGLPRFNGQVKRLNSTVIAVISKLSKDDPKKWFKFVPELQRILNSTYQRSINLTPFELLGVKMREKTDLKIRELIEEEIRSNFQKLRENLRKGAKQQILKVQESNRKTYNLTRKPPNKYKINDIVAIKRTQHGPGLKFKSKFLGPYKITKIKPNDTYC